MELIEGLIWGVAILIGLAIYFLPAIIAVNRNHPHPVAIICLNLFTGWSFVGWMVSMVWSCIHLPQEREANFSEDLPQHPDPRFD